MTGRYRTTLTGAFPRPEALVQATRDVDRGRIPSEKAGEAFAAAGEEIRRLEADLRLDAVTGGYLRWQDLFRPFTDLWSGVSAGALTRFFETNTFFRQPVLAAPPAPGRGRLADWLPHGPRARAVVPGPFTFACLADVQYAPNDRGRATLDIATALAEELRSLGATRPPFVQFQEPMLAYGPPRGGLPELVEAYRHLVEACAGASTAVWTYFGDAGPVLPLLARLPVDVVGFDLFQTTIPPGIPWGSKGIGLGCLDPTTTLPEDVAAVASLARAAESSLRPSVVWLGPNPPLDLLPFDAAVAKLKLLPGLQGMLER